MSPSTALTTNAGGVRRETEIKLVDEADMSAPKLTPEIASGAPPAVGRPSVELDATPMTAGGKYLNATICES
jgi:hypothetical protein